MKITTQFCQYCNARERVIEHGKCIICGNPPEMRVETTDLPKLGHVDWPEWTWLDRYVLVLCVVVSLYLLWNVVKWLI